MYKEDFDKFVNALNDTVDHVKTELLPEVDFSQFDNNVEVVAENEKEKEKEKTETSIDDELSWD